MTKIITLNCTFIDKYNIPKCLFLFKIENVILLKYIMNINILKLLKH